MTLSSFALKALKMSTYLHLCGNSGLGPLWYQEGRGLGTINHYPSCMWAVQCVTFPLILCAVRASHKPPEEHLPASSDPYQSSFLAEEHCKKKKKNQREVH